MPTIEILAGGQQRFAVPECVPRRGDEASREACRTLTQVLRRDLAFENFFRFVPENLLSAIPPLDPESPNYADWQGIGANVLVVTRAQVTGGELTVEATVHAVDSRQTILSKRYSGRAENPRIFAHQLSDEIMAAAQQKGVARTKIAFVSDRDQQGPRRSKELYIMDYDGFNPRRVTVNRSINILPAWSPDGRSLAYVSYRQGQPDVFVASIFEARSTNLTEGRGQAFAPAFSPDGRRIAYASSRGGNMDIWVASADGTGARKITTSAALDTAPAWSPTGQEIVFTSDRSGTPQIYLMDAEGLNVRRLSSVGNYNDAPAWNPSRQYSEIAYTSRLEGGTFDIAVVDLASRQVRQITQGRGSCEYPSWAPSGRHLVFACRRARGGTWQITVADRDGRNVQTLPAGAGNNAYPDWGPSAEVR
ncbi:MAG TPA: Tol-Pal system beta propeller repeat protein TolB [Vicinamibacteria bacterium]